MELIQKYFSEFTPAQLKQFESLGPLYREWNSKINVISRKDIGALYEKHVLHSLSIAAVFDFPEKSEIIDIGTGGGFPGIPLAIYFPEVHFHLVDSIGKKLKVVSAIVEEIGLRNVTTQHSRAEEIRTRKFDYAVSRAVAPLNDLWKWSRPLLKKSASTYIATSESTKDSRLPTPDSGLVCLKGGDLSLEIQQSGLRPRMVEISHLFAEESFKDKYLLYIQRQ